MRTGFSLFQDLTEPPQQQAATGEVRKGRNAELIAKRDLLLIRRFVYYIKYTELRTDAVTARLEEEFHLTSRHFLNIIYDRAAEIKAMKASPPSLTEYRTWYPHLVWITTRAKA